jgi:DNA-binding protein HU-beta
MNKSELIDSVVEYTGMMKKDSEKAVNAVVESISEALAKGEKVQLIGFGTFDIRKRNAREGRNPSTGETIKIPAQNVPVFKPGKGLKDKVK